MVNLIPNQHLAWPAHSHISNWISNPVQDFATWVVWSWSDWSKLVLILKLKRWARNIMHFLIQFSCLVHKTKTQKVNWELRKIAVPKFPLTPIHSIHSSRVLESGLICILFLCTKRYVKMYIKKFGQFIFIYAQYYSILNLIPTPYYPNLASRSN